MGSIAGIVSAAWSGARDLGVAGSLNAVASGARTGMGFMQDQQEAQGASLRGRFENDVAERNAQIAEKQGADASNLGELEANRERGQTGQEISSGRAAAGASGADVSTGSAAAQTASQQLIGDVDALTIRNNAARQAWGFDVQAANERMQGRLAQLAGENEAATDRVSSYGTLLTAATSAYGSYLKNRKVNPGGSGTPNASSWDSGGLPSNQGQG